MDIKDEESCSISSIHSNDSLGIDLKESTSITTVTTQESSTSSPKDKESIIFYLSLLLGIGSCVPWFVFINAVEYFSIRFCSENSNNDDFIAIFGFVSNASNVATLIGILFMEQYCGGDGVKGIKGVMRCFVISLAVLSFHAILVLVTSSLVDPTVLFWLCLISLVVFGICSSYITTQLLAQLMQLFPSSIGITPYTAGISVGGLLVSLITVGTSLLDDVQKDDYIASHCTSIDHHRKLDSTTQCVPYTVDYITFCYFLTPCFILIGCILAYRHLTSFFPLYHEIQSNPYVDNDALDQPLLEKNPTSSTPTDFNIYSKLIHLILSISFIYFCTYTLFPGYIGTITSVNQCKSLETRVYNDLFTPILFITFNVFELGGKLLAPPFYTFSSYYLSSLENYTTIHYNLFLTLSSFLRIILLLYFFSLKPSLDIYTIVLVAITGISNGCLANTCFLYSIILTPKHLTTSTSAILNFFLYVGLFVGSAFSIFYISLVE